MENMENIENDYAEARLRFREVESSLIVLQQAVQNEEEAVTLENIDDNLEIIIEILHRTIEKLDATIDKQFATISLEDLGNQIKNLAEQ